MNPYATLPELRDWAYQLMSSRSPDVVIGDDYLRRWHVLPRNEHANVYLHEILTSDDERAMHDHPSNNSSLLLEGSYYEHTPEGLHLRVAGDFVQREAWGLHRLELNQGKRVVSLFTTGPKIRDWGFQCGDRWVPWEDFCEVG